MRLISIMSYDVNSPNIENNVLPHSHYVVKEEWICN